MSDSRLTRDRHHTGQILLRFLEQPGRVDEWLRGSALPRTRVLTYGVLREALSLRADVQPALRRPWDALDPPVRVALLLGAWELRHCPDVASATAVDQAVELVRALGGKDAVGLVNAALRKVAAEPPRELAPPQNLDDLSVGSSHPRWILDVMAVRRAMDGVLAWAMADNVAAPMVVHRRDSAEALPGVELGPHAVRLPAGAGPLEALPGWSEGRVWVQDLAAQWVASLADPGPGGRVLDVCAAPGGKSFLLADRVGPAGVVAAWDVDEDRLRALDRERRRLRQDQVRPALRDLLEAPWGTAPGDLPFDSVLVDAPCSALGVIRRHPEIRWTRQPQDLARLAQRQLALLEASAPAVGAGGLLVYAVCTFSPEETDGVLARFLGSQAGRSFQVEAPRAPAAYVDGGWFRSYPDRDDMDAFSAVVLRSC